MAARETGYAFRSCARAMCSRATPFWPVYGGRGGKAAGAGTGHAAGELYMADGTELWHDVLARAEDTNQPCSVRDMDGRPWLYQPNDARDIAHLLVCAVEEPGAVDDSFNCGAPVPFSFRRRRPSWLKRAVSSRWRCGCRCGTSTTMTTQKPAA